MDDVDFLSRLPQQPGEVDHPHGLATGEVKGSTPTISRVHDAEEPEPVQVLRAADPCEAQGRYIDSVCKPSKRAVQHAYRHGEPACASTPAGPRCRVGSRGGGAAGHDTDGLFHRCDVPKQHSDRAPRRGASAPRSHRPRSMADDC